MLGPIGGFHVEPMAVAVQERGYDVTLAGPIWPGYSHATLETPDVPVAIRTWPTSRWMRRLLRDTQPDLVHAHWMPIAALALLYGASPLVVSAWGSDVFQATRGQRLAWRLALRQVDLSLGSSRALLRELERLGAPPTRTALINWGVNLDEFRPADERLAARARLGLPPGPVILSPRSTGDVYNVDVITKAFEPIARERPDVTLVLLRGEEGVSATTSEQVKVIQRVPAEVMPDYYRAADICVSIATTDSSPRSVWEAMACGTPCLVSDIPWVHELLIDEDNALIVSIDDKAVEAGIRRLLFDSELAALLSERGRVLVEQHRDREREMDRLCALYQHVITDGRHRSRFARRVSPIAASMATVQAVARRALHLERA
jgi:glycosyltransferase involved in cell wall biosynthesis